MRCRMFVLELNPITGRLEQRNVVCMAETRERLEQFMANEAVEEYREDKGDGSSWLKRFRSGGPLEWYNPPDGYSPHIVDIGTEEGFVEEARARYRQYLSGILKVD